MTESCPDCGAPLFFNPELQVSECRRCGGYFFPEDINAAEQRALSIKDNSNALDNQSGENLNEEANIDSDISPEYIEEFIESPIYTCNQCGAEIIINSTEASTFCLYCGCPTLVFSRISQTRKPKYIIPFQISHEKALSLCNEKLKHSFFAPKSVRHIKLDDIHGIYIPYWLTDIDYEATANIEIHKTESNSYSENKNHSDYTESIIHVARCGICSFKRITTDASYTLPNNFSKCLEPYNTSKMKSFNKNYLAGFYSDIANITYAEGKEDALERAEDMFDTEMERALKYNGGGKVRSKVGTYQITNCESAMFPAWFITLRYKNMPYTIAINGQTGKVNGILPVDYTKFTILTIFLALLIWGITLYMVMHSVYAFIALGVITMLGLFTLAAGIRKLKRIKTRLRQAKSGLVYCYVHKRQGGDW